MPILTYPDDGPPMASFGAIDFSPKPEGSAPAEPQHGGATGDFGGATGDWSDPTLEQTVAAAFRQDNSGISLLNDHTLGVDLYSRDGVTGDEIWKDIEGTRYEPHWDRFAGLFNRPAVSAMKAQIDMEDEDRKTLAASGGTGIAASVGASILDPTNLLIAPLLPELGFARAGTTAARMGRAAAEAGAVGGGAAVFSEGALQATQQARPTSESLRNVGGGALLGAFLGAGAGALMSHAERRAAVSAAQKAFAEPADTDTVLRDLGAGMKEGMAEPESFGAAVPEGVGAEAVDLGRIEDYAIQGTGAKAIGKSIAKLNPLTRAAQSPSLRHRAFMADLQETGYYLSKNARGEGNIAVETARKFWERGALGQGLRKMGAIYEDARKAGLDMDKREFNDAISRSMRRGDVSDVAAVQEAARMWRSSLLDPLKDEAIKAGILDPNVSVTTATSYLSRLWSLPKLTAREAEFKQRVSSWLDGEVRSMEMRQQEIGVGNQVVDAERLRESHQRLADRLASLEEQIAGREAARRGKLTTIDTLIGARKSALEGRAPQHILDALGNADQNKAIVDVVRDARAAEQRAAKKPTRAERFPVIDLIRKRGGVRQGSTLAGELRAMGATPKDHPGLFKKAGGIGDVDNFVRQEHPVLETLPADERGYVNRDAILNAISDELAGNPLRTTEDMVAGANAEGLSEQATQWLEALGLDPNATVGAVREFIRGVTGNEKALGTVSERILRLEQELEAFDTATDALRSERAVRATEAKTANEELQKLEAEIDSVSDIANASPKVKLIVDYAKTRRDLYKARLQERTLRRRVEALRRMENEGTANEAHLAELTAKETDLSRIEADIAGMAAKADELKPMVPTVKKELPDFVSPEDRQGYIQEITNDIFNTLTGRARSGDLSYDIPMAARGPLRERTFNIPDVLVEDFLENNIELIARRYARIMSTDIELANMSKRHGFSGNPNLEDMMREVRKDYAGLRQQIVDGDLPAPEKERQLKRLKNREKRDITDMAGVRDILRGTYKIDSQHGFGARAASAAMSFNFLRLMGGVLVSSLADAARPAMVHGLGRYMSEGIAPLVTNLKAIKMSAEDARIAGAVAETVLHSRLASISELADPYAMNSPFERFLGNVVTGFAKATGLLHWNDFHKEIAFRLTENRLLRNAMDGMDNLSPSERNYMGYLGLDADMAARIAAQFDQFGMTDGNVHVANLAAWEDKAARRAFAAAVNKDVDSTIATPGAGDKPLFMNTPMGRALGQFRSFSLASNQRYLMRASSEGGGRFVSGLMLATTMGMLTYWLNSMIAGRDVSDNPAMWITHGLDNGGIFALPFEVDRAWEAVGGPGAYWAAGKMFPDKDQGYLPTRLSARNWADETFGPSVGLAKDAAQLAFAGMSHLRPGSNARFTASDVRAARRLTPFANLPYFRWAIDNMVVPKMVEATKQP